LRFIAQIASMKKDHGAGSIQNLAAIFLETDGSIRNMVVPAARTDAGLFFNTMIFIGFL
jgi:hypothetical protein